MDKTINLNIDNIFFIIIILNTFFIYFNKLYVLLFIPSIHLTYNKNNNELMANKTQDFNILNFNAFCILS